MKDVSDVLKENERLRTRLQQVENSMRRCAGDDSRTLVDPRDAADASLLSDEILGYLADAVIAVDKADRISHVNSAAECLFTLAASDVLGRLHTDVFTTPLFRNEDLAQDRPDWLCDHVRTTVDGREQHLECRVTKRKDTQGQPNGWVAVIRDVSERQEHDRRVVVSELRYRRLFEAAQDGILIVDPDTGKIIDANPFMVRLLGYSHADLLNMKVSEIGLFRDETVNSDMFQILKDVGQVRYENLPMQRNDGAFREVEVVANRYAENGHGRIHFTIRDITERRLVQRARTDSDKRFRLALDNSPITVFEQDLDLRYTWIYNPKLGYTASTTLGKTDAELMDADLAAHLTAIKQGVLESGQPARREVTVAPDGKVKAHFRLIVEPRLGLDGQIDGILCTSVDITDEKIAAAALIEEQARQAFLLKLSDTLRPLSSPIEVQAEACRMLGEHLGASRAYYAENEGEGEAPDIAVIHRDYANGVASLAGRYIWSDFVTENRWHLVAGRTLAIDDTQDDVAFSDDQRAAFLAISMVACLIVPLVKNGVHVATFAVAHARPWAWTDEEVALVEDVAERTWAAVERAHAEARLHIAHDTFRTLIDRSPFGTYIVDSDLRMVQMSDGGQKAFGVDRSLVGQDFSAVVHTVWPDPFATEVIDRFRHTLATGEPFQAETNERRADVEATEAYDWKIERIILPDGRFGVVCHFYDLSEKQRQEDRIKLLMGEVNHRSKNMLSLVEAIARQTAKTQPEQFLEIFGQRLRALSASQDLLVKGGWTTVELGELVRSQLGHFGDEHDGRITIDGPQLDIAASVSQSLGMALHELATNAAKFGALSNETGWVVISWSLQLDTAGQAEFAMSWIERGGPQIAEPAHLGFGSAMIDGMLRDSLGCQAEITFAPTGLTWRIYCAAADIIRGDVAPAPQSNGTFGHQQAVSDSAGRILVVEDEPLIAMLLSMTLTEEGYEVIGPANSVNSALALLEKHGCDAALLDIHLRSETSEPIARELVRLGTPFLSLSGYSREQLPQIMQAAPLLRKPVSTEMLLEEIERCLVRKTAPN